jgi:hypothetical protein
MTDANGDLEIFNHYFMIIKQFCCMTKHFNYNDQQAASFSHYKKYALPSAGHNYTSNKTIKCP